MAKQLAFRDSAFKKRIVFGGQLLKGNARESRPTNSKLPLHLVLRSHGRISMRNPLLFNAINEIVERVARKYGVKVYEYANAGNHIHLLIRVTKRQLWSAFIREITGRIALKTKRFGRTKFWIYKSFTRVVSGWKKAFNSVRDYVTLNRHEADGAIKRGDVKNLRELYAIWSETA